MLTQEEKARRYDILEYAFILRLRHLKKDLALEFNCEEDDIPLDELEKRIDSDLRFFIDELFPGQPAIFYLLDRIICEKVPVPLLPIQEYFPITCH